MQLSQQLTTLRHARVGQPLSILVIADDGQHWQYILLLALAALSAPEHPGNGCARCDDDQHDHSGTGLGTGVARGIGGTHAIIPVRLLIKMHVSNSNG
jgi:hypothetical protein